MRDARGIRATAFLWPPRDRLTVVVLNSGTADASVRLDEGSFPTTLYEGHLTVLRPGKSETWKTMPPKIVNGGLSFALATRSVATIVLYAGPERRWTAPDQIEYQRRD